MQTKTLTLTLPKPHPAQRQIIANLRRFNIPKCGRRFGKDIFCTNELIKPALAGYPVAWFAPSYKMLSENWRSFKNLLHPVVKRISEQEKQLELITGGVIDMWSLDRPDSARGRKYKRVVINEAAMVKDLVDVWNMVIRPTLVDYQGDAFFPSTPKGLNGFFTLWQAAKDDPNWAIFHHPTSDNPYIPASEIDALRLAMPERAFRQEILAEFIENGSYFQGVDKAAVIEKPDEPAQHKGHQVFMGIDWAMSQDFTVIPVGCRDCNRVVDWERFNKIDFTYQRERVITMAKRWNIQGALPERNSIGQPNIEILKQSIPILLGPDLLPGFQTTATTKPALIEGLANGLEHENFKVPLEAQGELLAYEVTFGQAGHPKFSAPEGQHDDWVIGLALLWRAMVDAKIQIFL